MEYLIMPWLIGSLVGVYFASNTPHRISWLFNNKFKPGMQATIFLGLFVVSIVVMWTLYDVPEPGIYKLEPLPGGLFDLIG